MMRLLVNLFPSRHCEAAKRPKQSIFEIASSPLAPRNDNKGFTLLEILLAILLLGTGLAILLQIVSAGLFAGSVNEDEIVATYLAQEKVEELRNALYSSIGLEAKEVVTDFPAFSRQVDFTTPQTSLKQITVTVYWFAGKTETSLAMVTYVSDV